jgi:hypothetical protein
MTMRVKKPKRQAVIRTELICRGCGNVMTVDHAPTDKRFVCLECGTASPLAKGKRLGALPEIEFMETPSPRLGQLEPRKLGERLKEQMRHGAEMDRVWREVLSRDQTIDRLRIDNDVLKVAVDELGKKARLLLSARKVARVFGITVRELRQRLKKRGH